MTIDELYQDTKLNYRLYLLAGKMVERKELDGKVVPRKIIEALLMKKGILDRMPLFIDMLPLDYWN